MKRRTRILAALALAATATIALASTNPIVGGKEMFPGKDIIDNAVNSADHTTLVAAVKAADLVGTLKGKGPFTVFAPTDEAFAKVSKKDMDALAKDKKKLEALLKGHVVGSKMMAADVAKAKDATMLNGKKFAIAVKGSDVTITSGQAINLDL